MTAIETALRAVAQTLVELERPFALVGGLAVSARTEPRFTRDIDLAVVVASDHDAEALVFALRSRGYARGRDLVAACEALVTAKP